MARPNAHWPSANRGGTGIVFDDSTSVPVVLPDGSILYGALTRYPHLQGHLMKFSASGQFLASYPFGWDDTPAVYPHDGTYSIITFARTARCATTSSSTSPCAPPTRRSPSPPTARS